MGVVNCTVHAAPEDDSDSQRYGDIAQTRTQASQHLHSHQMPISSNMQDAGHAHSDAASGGNVASIVRKQDGAGWRVVAQYDVPQHSVHVPCGVNCVGCCAQRNAPGDVSNWRWEVR